MPVQKGIIPSNLPGLLLCIADRFLGQNSETIVMGCLNMKTIRIIELRCYVNSPRESSPRTC